MWEKKKNVDGSKWNRWKKLLTKQNLQKMKLFAYNLGTRRQYVDSYVFSVRRDVLSDIKNSILNVSQVKSFIFQKSFQKI